MEVTEGRPANMRPLKPYYYAVIALWVLVTAGSCTVGILRTRSETGEIAAHLASHAPILLLGLVGIAIGARRLERREKERDQASKALRCAYEELESRVEMRTSELRSANEELLQEIEVRRKAVEALRDSEARYRRLVENAPLGILSFSKDGEITEANPLFLKILSSVSSEASSSINVLTSPRVVGSGWASDFSRCVNSGERIISERNYVSGEGKQVTVRLHLACLKDKDDNIIGGQAIVEDITERERAREGLRASERRFRSLFESAGEFIHILDLNGTILQTNPAVVAGLGYSEEELIGRPIVELLAPASQKAFFGQFPSSLHGGFLRQELELVSKQGSIITVDSHCSVTRDERGKIASLVLFQRDITERKLAGERIEQQNRFLSAVLESLTHPFYVIDAHDYTVLLANSAARQSFSREGAQCYALTHGRNEPCNTAFHPCPLVEVKKTGKAVSTEHIHYDQSGAPGHFEVHAYPIFDTEGNVAQIIEYALDITERRRIEEALRESEAKMRLIIESAPVGIGIAQQGRYQYVNQALVKMFGYDGPHEIIGLPTSDLIRPEYREKLLQASRDVLEARATSRFHEIAGKRKNGNTFEATVWLTKIEHEDQPAILEFITDVSEERRLRSHLVQAQKMDATGTLAGGIAHDFNNLLQAIQGYSELALFNIKKGDPGYSEFQVIVGAARKGGELTQGLLTFSRQVESKMRPLDLNREIREVTKLLNRTIPKMISSELHLAENLNIVNADPVQVQQVVMNLALNARDAMPEGGKLIMETRNVTLDSDYCYKHLEVPAGEYVLLSVSDTGYGMDKNTRNRIFEPFFTTKERGKGSGLGLSIVYGIVKSHGGNISCYSEPGVGTTFQIYFPALEHAAIAADQRDSFVVEGGNETILLIDDESSIRNLGKKILERFGYTVLTAENGRLGLDGFTKERGKVSLVILDLMMPEMSGWECLREMLKIDPNVKVVVASGYTAEGRMEEIRREGAKEYIRKPYETRQMLELVRRVLDADGPQR